MSQIEQAIFLALKAHKGQVDKAGAPYILHPLRVMLSLSDEKEMIAAVLHDIVEDTDFTLEDLRNEGFPEEIILAVDCLTRKQDETYDDFITRASKNVISKSVKLADLKDNMNLSRIKNPGEKDFERIKKYEKAVSMLTES